MLGVSFLSTNRQVLLTLHVTIETSAELRIVFELAGLLKKLLICVYEMLFVFHLIYNVFE